MHLYKDELAISELILANTSIAYLVDVEPLDISSPAFASIYNETPSTPDLFYTKSVFVTTNKNKNDDVFLPDETWAARKTPVDKMWNIEHNHAKVVGHITSTWAIDADGSIMSDDTEELPSLFHLCTAGVIYKKWQDAEMQEEVDELIDGIKAGEFATSMEAYFNNMAYVLYKGDEVKVIDRDESTAFLTKHLRAYGGSGEYDGYKLGRGLRNIIFGGNAFTKKPANPDSVIFSNVNDTIFANLIKNEKLFLRSGVTPFKEEIIMSDNILEKQVAELKDQIKQLTLANKELSDGLATASVEKYEVELASLRDQVAAAQKTLADAEAKVQSVETAKSALAEELKGLNDKYVAVATELDEVRKGAILASRTSKLIEIGLSKEDAENKAKNLVALSDEQFDSLASIIASVKPPVVPGSASPPAVPGAKEAPVVSGSEEELEEEEDGVDATIASDSSDESELLAVFAAYYDEQLSKEKK
jgi:hypothetical protein